MCGVQLNYPDYTPSRESKQSPDPHGPKLTRLIETFTTPALYAKQVM